MIFFKIKEIYDIITLFILRLRNRNYLKTIIENLLLFIIDIMKLNNDDWFFLADGIMNNCTNNIEKHNKYIKGSKRLITHEEQERKQTPKSERDRSLL